MIAGCQIQKVHKIKTVRPIQLKCEIEAFLVMIIHMEPSPNFENRIVHL